MITRDRIQYRVGSFGTRADGSPWATFLIYIDARTASEELDGLYDGKWSFAWEEIESQKWAIKGKLTVTKDQGLALKYEDVGYPNDFKKGQDPNDSQWMKDAISDALKRCAVQAGVGRELYDTPLFFVEGAENIQTRKSGAKEYFKKLTPSGEKIMDKKIDDWYSKANKIDNFDKEVKGDL